MSKGKIDFVVTWVDGNDEKWQKEKAKYSPVKTDNSSSNNRYRDWGIMKYWFRGVEKFAPWVNHIYFVTCGHVPEWLNLDNPKLTLVKHTDYIPEEFLPTFNSNTIEMYSHKIPGLAEQYVIFNDDMVLISPTEETDFFVDGIPCESALLGTITADNPGDVFPHILVNNNAIINKNFSKKKVIKDNFFKFYNLKYGKHLLRNLALIPFSSFSDFYDLHLTKSVTKSLFEEVWNAEPEAMLKGTSSRFRSRDDVNIWLIKEWYLCKGHFCPRSTKFGRKFELGEEKGFGEYISGQKGKLICINDSSDKIDFDSIQPELIEAFNKILPDKSSFEK